MSQKLFFVFAIILIARVVCAHGAHGSGIMEGFTHPILGLDHFIAIFGTGVIGYLLKPSKWYLSLFTFILLMIVGGAMGITNEATTVVEKTIAFSVLAIGVLIAFDFKIGLLPSLILLAIFGFFHGYAHGAEMSETNTVVKYISGYTIGAGLTGTLGVGLSKVILSISTKEEYSRIIGGIITGCGLIILLG